MSPFGDDPGEEFVKFGDASSLPPVSMKVIQSIYNEITGKTEKLERHYDHPFQVRMADFEQLNHKMSQSFEQYDVKALNVGVTVYHLNDTSETFSSFDRFKFYNKSNTNPVQSVVLKYDLLILLPKINKSQSYEITIRVTSSIVEWKSLMDKLTPVPSMFVRFVGIPSAVVSIKYVDYLVARNLSTVIDSWFDALSKDEPPRWLRFVRKHLTFARPLAEYLMAFFVLWLALRVLTGQLSNNSSNLQHLAQVMLVALSALFLSYRFGHFIGHRIENAILSWRDLGYVELNRGDEKEIGAAQRENRKSLLKAAMAIASEFAVALVAHITALALSH